MINWLTQEATSFLYDHFEMSLDIPIKINTRLKRTLGLYKIDGNSKPKQIDLSTRLIENGNESIILDVLKHELVHYAIHRQGKPYKDQSKEFIETCRALNISLTRTYTGANTHRYQCLCQTHEFQHKLQLKKCYYCKKCRIQLTYLGPVEVNIRKVKD